MHYKCIKLESNYVGCGIRCEIRCRFVTLISLSAAINNSKTGLHGEDDAEAKRRGDVRNLNTEIRNGVRVIEGDWRESLCNLILESNSDVKIGARDLERTNPSTRKIYSI